MRQIFIALAVLFSLSSVANAQMMIMNHEDSYAEAAKNMVALGQLYQTVIACTRGIEPKLSLATRIQQAAANALRSPILNESDLGGLVHSFYAQPELNKCPATVIMPSQDETNLKLAAMVARAATIFEQ
jgi:hypothetical protein